MVPHEITVKVAAGELGLSPGRVRQLAQEGRIKGARKWGRDWMIPTPVQVVGMVRGRPAKANDEETLVFPRDFLERQLSVAWDYGLTIDETVDFLWNMAAMLPENRWRDE